MSFPLSQDVGFDPSLYTIRSGAREVLVRDVIAYGQRRLHVGLIKSLRFHATPASVFQLDYEFRLGGPPGGARFVLAAFDGTSYSAELPDTDGLHEVQIHGNKLHLPAGGSDIQAILVEANVSNPILGSHNRLRIENFEVQAERGRRVPLASPSLVPEPGTGIQVADEVVKAGQSLQLKLGAVTSPVKVTLYNGAGKLEKTVNLTLMRGQPELLRSIPLGSRATPGLWKAKLSYQDGSTTFRFLVLGKVPPHPRVLLSSVRIEQLRAQRNSNLLLKIIERQALQLRAAIAYNPHAGDNIAMLPWSSAHPATPSYFRLMENYSNAIVYNALAFRLNGSQQALEAARKGLLTVCQWRTWTPGWFPGLYTYYEVGVFSQRVALAYDLIANQFTAGEKALIAHGFWQNSIEPTLKAYFLRDRLPIASSNWMPNSVGGAIDLAAALYDDVPNWNHRLGVALAELMVSTENLLNGGLFPGDDSEAEPAGYENFAMEGMSWALAPLHFLGIRPAGTDRMMQAFWWPDYAMVKPNLVLDTGDFNGRIDQGVSGFAWPTEYSRNADLRAFYDRVTGPLLEAMFHGKHAVSLYARRPGPLDLVCCTKPAAAPTLPPDSRIFPLRGSAVLRSGWSSTATVISLRVGPWFNHEHHDEGSFQVTAFGEKLISEAGYTHYYSDPHYQDYFTQAAGHNTVLIDGDPFSQSAYNGRFWPAFSSVPRFTGHVFSPAIDYVAADLSPAYDGRLSEYRREYLFLKPYFLLVHDRLAAPKSHRFTWLLHVPTGDPTRIEGPEAMIQGSAAGAILTAAGRNVLWKIHGTPLSISDYAELDRARVLPHEEFQINSQLGKTVDFLVGMHFVKLPWPQRSMQPINVSGGEGFQNQSEGRGFAAVFRTGEGSLSAEGFSTDGDALAVLSRKGEKDILASDAESLRQQQRLLITSTSPVYLVLHQAPGETQLHIVNPVPANVRVRAERPPAVVLVDHKQVGASLLKGFISLGRLAGGEHLVKLMY